MKTWKLSKRLSVIADMIKDCEVLADIGCDHGYTCLEALERGKAGRAIAADIGEGPLAIARDNAEAAGLSDRCIFVRSDGLKELPSEPVPDAVCITGMGGHLVTRILKEAETAAAGIRQVILGPQSDLDVVRRYIVTESPFMIRTERMVEEDGKYYVLMDLCQKDNAGADKESTAADKKVNAYTESEFLYGRQIEPEDMETKASYLQYQHGLMEEAYRSALRGCSYGVADKQQEIRHRLQLIEEAQEALKKGADRT